MLVDWVDFFGQRSPASSFVPATMFQCVRLVSWPCAGRLNDIFHGSRMDRMASVKLVYGAENEQQLTVLSFGARIETVDLQCSTTRKPYRVEESTNGDIQKVLNDNWILLSCHQYNCERKEWYPPLTCGMYPLQFLP